MFSVLAIGLLPAHQYMHIPDGYLSPVTAAVLFLLMLPFWARGTRRLREKIASQNEAARQVPLIALIAAFSFVIMLFNLPLPGGTTGHAVGGALAAIVLGPEIASVAISIALIIQAFFFGDGGILAIGANCFNMAVVLPYVSYAVYRAIGGRSEVTSRRRTWGAALGGYLGLTAAALFTALEFGIQPALFKAADGTPLYAPYPLSVAIPAMVLPHLAVVSVVEGLLTALVVGYLQGANSAVLQAVVQAPAVSPAPAVPPPLAPRRMRWLWLVLIVLVLASPLGLLAPGTAWGEWSGAQLARMGTGVAPRGMAALQGLWGAPLPGYNLPALGDARLGYVLSALLGAGLIALIGWLIVVAMRAMHGTEPGPEATPASAASSQPSPHGARSRVVQRTVAQITGALDQSLFAERIAQGPGLLQSLDPRVKLISTLLLLLAASLSRSIPVIAALYVLTLILAWRSAVPMSFFVKRVWLLLPFFTAMIALPALFVIPGPALAHLPLGLVITRTGLTSALFLLLRVGTSVSAAVLLILTTPWNSVLKTLGALCVPDALVVMLGMTYRYIYLLLQAAGDMLLSRESRVVGRMSASGERRLMAASAGVLLSRSLQLSSDVYLAMQSRGFRGYPRTMDTFQMRRRDWLYAAATLLAFGLAVWLGR